MAKRKPEIAELRKHQIAMQNNTFPGYPYQDSIIIDCGANVAYDHDCHKRSINGLLKDIYSRLLYLTIGHTESTKSTWLQNRHISSVEHFTNSLFNPEEIYIDSTLAARFYLAIQSALCDIKDHDKNNAILWACIDENCDFIDCRVFTSLEEIKKYSDEYLAEEE